MKRSAQAYLTDKLKKLLVILETPGALNARLAGCYFELYREVRSLRQRGCQPATILDIGANRGMFTRCAHHVFPEAEIHAFEPLRDCYTALCGLKTAIPTLTCYRVAVADAEGEITMHHSSYDYSSSLLAMSDLHKTAFPYSAGEQLERVPMAALDSILSGQNLARPLLIKIDVQGYEMPVLRGAAHILQQADVVICETSFVPLYEGQALFDEVNGYLQARGFRFCGQLGELVHPATHAVLQIDALFVRQPAEAASW